VAITPVPAVVAKAGLPSGVNPTLLFDLQKFDQAVFDGLSDGLKNQIMQSAEFQTQEPKSLSATEDAIEDDEVPF